MNEQKLVNVGTPGNIDHGSHSPVYRLVMRKLKPPKNLRYKRPRCCLTCKHRISEKIHPESDWDETVLVVCERDHLSREDEPEFNVCDYYA